MKRHAKVLLALTLMVVTFSTCEKVDLSPKDNSTHENSTYNGTLPTSVGKGSQDSPCTVTQIMQKSVQGQVWVIGYAVGATYRSMSNAEFDVPLSYNTNILLSDVPQCSSTDMCIAVELPSSMRSEFALSENPDMHRKCIMIFGYTDTYFSQPGIKKISEAFWLPDFDIETINPTPEEWDYIEWR